jgi:hypothetical protein
MRLASLALIAALSGAATMAVYRRAGSLDSASRTLKRLVAHLAEFRLYASEPVLIGRAQLAAMRESARLFLLMAKPSLLVALPMAWLLVQIDSTYGHAPLPLNEPAIVTVHLARALDAADAASSLTAPPEIAVETSPVRAMAPREISWRLRPLRAVRGDLTLKLREGELTKSIDAGGAGAWLSRCRMRPLAAFLLHPEERRLPPGDVQWIEVSYPAAPWLTWFLAFSTLGAGLAIPLWNRLERRFW